MNNPDWSKERVIDFNDFRCRCSAISKIMANSRSNPVLTELQKEELGKLRSKPFLSEVQVARLAELETKEHNGKKVILSDTCIEYLMEWYAWETEGMIPIGKESLDNVEMKKGKLCEDEGIAALSVVDGVDYKKHKDRIFNDYLSGEIDCYAGNSVYEADVVPDIKNSFDYPTYLKKINKDVENGQTEQLQGYGDITGAKQLYVVECLITAPAEIVTKMMWKLAAKMDAITIESPEFLEEWKIWEHSMNFQHIPVRQRVFQKKIEPFTEFERQKLYDRVKVCREWLFTFHERFVNLNKSVSLV